MFHPHLSSSVGLLPGHRVRMGADGRIVIPADIRHHIGAVAGDEFTVESDATGIRLRTMRQLVAEAQAYFTEGLAPGELVSEEVRRDRRAEAARE